MERGALSSQNYLKNPFYHCVIDNFLNSHQAEIIYNCLQKFNPHLANIKFTDKKNIYEYNKFAFSNIRSMPHSLKMLFVHLNSYSFINELEKLTGVRGIVCGDLNLIGAGVHVIKKGGYLEMHTDFNGYFHPKHGYLDRRINLLLYMNKNWSSDYNGDLIMYNPHDLTDVKKISPLFNRCVIFNTSSKSIHGHPEPLNVPSEDIYRKSIAIYYYTKNNNKDNLDFEGQAHHSTIWHKK